MHELDKIEMLRKQNEELKAELQAYKAKQVLIEEFHEDIYQLAERLGARCEAAEKVIYYAEPRTDSIVEAMSAWSLVKKGFEAEQTDALKITPEHLKAFGFRKHVRGKGGLGFMQSPDDCCIDLSPVHLSGGDEWHCWIGQEEPFRFVHVRHLKYMHEVAQLFKGLTGTTFTAEPDR